jgi:hypothetical protein
MYCSPGFTIYKFPNYHLLTFFFFGISRISGLKKKSFVQIRGDIFPYTRICIPGVLFSKGSQAMEWYVEGFWPNSCREFGSNNGIPCDTIMCTSVLAPISQLEILQEFSTNCHLQTHLRKHLSGTGLLEFCGSQFSSCQLNLLIFNSSNSKDERSFQWMRV